MQQMTKTCCPWGWIVLFLFFDIACRPVVMNALSAALLQGVALTDALIILLNRAYDVLYLAA